MAAKTLATNKRDLLVKRIRSTANRRIELSSPRLEKVTGYETLLRVMSRNSVFGIVRAKDRNEAHRILSAKNVNLTIGWDHNRNEKVVANFLAQ